MVGSPRRRRQRQESAALVEEHGVVEHDNRLDPLDDKPLKRAIEIIRRLDLDRMNLDHQRRSGGLDVTARRGVHIGDID